MAQVPTQTPQSAEPAAANNNNNGQPDIMDMVLSDARHVQGDANAPVTIIEFSDFK